MVYHGKVKNGTIVLDASIDLSDGAAVRVELELAPWSTSRSDLGLRCARPPAVPAHR